MPEGKGETVTCRLVGLSIFTQLSKYLLYTLVSISEKVLGTRRSLVPITLLKTMVGIELKTYLLS